jgi:hypothetical protein
MASFAAQLKDKFLGLVDRVTGWGGCGAGAGRDKDVPSCQMSRRSCSRISPLSVLSIVIVTCKVLFRLLT